jgi:hypothetical protein
MVTFLQPIAASWAILKHLYSRMTAEPPFHQNLLHVLSLCPIPTRMSDWFHHLKVQSNEMVRPKLCSFDRSLLKRLKSEARRFPHPREPFEDFVPSCTAVGYLETNCQLRTQLCQLPFIHYIQVLATELWTHLESITNGALNILSPEFCYYLYATALWMLHNIGNVHWMVGAVENCAINAFRSVAAITIIPGFSYPFV